MRAGYVSHKHTNGSKIHLAVGIPGHLLALHVTPADDYDPAQVATLAAYLCVPNTDVPDSVRTLLDVCFGIVPHRWDEPGSQRRYHLWQEHADPQFGKPVLESLGRPAALLDQQQIKLGRVGRPH